LVIGYWSWVICYWSFVIGHLLLVICYWSLIPGLTQIFPEEPKSVEAIRESPLHLGFMRKS
jgi:hypothetical protein